MWPWKTWCQIAEGIFLLGNNREAEAQPVAETWYVALLAGKEAEARETRDRRHVLGQINRTWETHWTGDLGEVGRRALRLRTHEIQGDNMLVKRKRSMTKSYTLKELTGLVFFNLRAAGNPKSSTVSRVLWLRWEVRLERQRALIDWEVRVEAKGAEQ